MRRVDNKEMRRKLRNKWQPATRRVDWKRVEAEVNKRNPQVLRFIHANREALGTTVVDRVDEAMIVAGISARELAVRCGITNRSYQSSWWWGIRRRVLDDNFNPKLSTVCRIAVALGVEVWDLFEEFK